MTAMISPTLTNTQIRETLIQLLGSIAPEADFEMLDSTANLTETLDIDSFDFLNFLISLEGTMGVTVPEADYGQLVSLNDVVNYIAVHTQ